MIPTKQQEEEIVTATCKLINKTNILTAHYMNKGCTPSRRFRYSRQLMDFKKEFLDTLYRIIK